MFWDGVERQVSNVDILVRAGITKTVAPTVAGNPIDTLATFFLVMERVEGLTSPTGYLMQFLKHEPPKHAKRLATWFAYQSCDLHNPEFEPSHDKKMVALAESILAKWGKIDVFSLLAPQVEKHMLELSEARKFKLAEYAER